MNEIFRGVPPVTVHLAQANPLSNIINQISSAVPNLLYAIAILVIGFIVAAIASKVVKAALSRTTIDNQIAARITGRSDGAAVTNIEKWISSLVFWVIMIFVLVGFLNALQLTAVSQPLNALLGQIFAFLPRIGAAVVLLGVAWLLATLAKLLLTRGLQTFGLDDRLNQAGGGRPGGTQQVSISDTLGTALYWFIFLLFLPAILDALDLQGLLQPIQGLLNEILAILPNILAAVLIGVVGWFVARIVRLVVTNLLTATGIDRVGEKIGLSQATGGQGLSWLIGYIVYVLILIPAAIAALNALQIQAISGPAIGMLDQILSAVPRIFTAALILVLAYVLGKFVAELVSNILASIGFNRIFSNLGLPEQPQRDRSAPPPTGPTTPPTGIPPSSGPASSSSQATPSIQEQSPSELAGVVVLVGIMILATVPAVSVLGFEILTTIVRDLLLILGQVLVGLLIFGIGLYLANLAFSLIMRSGTNQAGVLAQVARIAIIGFASALALGQIGVASSIVNLAFGLLLGAIAVAIALAFGLGGMDVAAEQIREWLTNFKRKGNPPY